MKVWTPGSMFEILLIIEVMLILCGNIGFNFCKSCKKRVAKENDSDMRVLKSIKYLDALGEQNILNILHEER